MRELYVKSAFMNKSEIREGMLMTGAGYPVYITTSRPPRSGGNGRRHRASVKSRSGSRRPGSDCRRSHERWGPLNGDDCPRQAMADQACFFGESPPILKESDPSHTRRPSLGRYCACKPLVRTSKTQLTEEVEHAQQCHHRGPHRRFRTARSRLGFVTTAGLLWKCAIAIMIASQ